MYPIRLAATFLLMTLAAVAVLAVGIATFFQFRRVYSEWIVTPLGKAILAVWGIRMALHRSDPFPRTQTVYISNHTSTIDMFVLIALGLPSCRFFLSGYLRRLIPMGIIGYIIGIFWTVPQQYPERRRRIFERAARRLRRTGESVYLSPEGERVTTGEIGHFNKGAFHLAMDLGAPIVPLFIAIPAAANPGKGMRGRACTVDVYVKPPIDTRSWSLDRLEAHRDSVRNAFVAWNEEHRR